MPNDVTGHGQLRNRVAVILLPFLFASTGCREYADHTPRPDPPTAKYPSSVADPLPTGTVRGRVVWKGERPTIPPISGLIETSTGAKWGDAPNPYAPRIAGDGGVADVVVWLSPVDATQLKPWPYPPLVIEHADGKLRSVQTGVPERVGFVKLGDEVELIARGKGFHKLQARGAAYFGLAYPEPDRSRKRKLDTPGVVEISSATGDFWNSVEVIVCEHPYFAATDSTGRFEFENVPPGSYCLTACVRNWKIIDRDNDPETGKVVRLRYAEPVNVTRQFTLTTTHEVEVAVEAVQFAVKRDKP